jgi:hypothetical protein
LLPGVALAWVVPAGAVTAVELVTAGRVAPMVAVDIIAAFLLPFALLWLVASFLAPGDQPSRGEEDDDGGGRPPDDPDPVPPSGDLEIDWERLEADVHAYAQSRGVVA